MQTLTHQQLTKIYNERLSGKTIIDLPLKEMSVTFANGDKLQLPVTDGDMLHHLAECIVRYIESLKGKEDNLPISSQNENLKGFDNTANSMVNKPENLKGIIEQLNNLPQSDWDKRKIEEYNTLRRVVYKENSYLCVDFIADEGKISVYKQPDGTLINDKSPVFKGIMKAYHTEKPTKDEI